MVKSRDKKVRVVILEPDWLHDEHGHYAFERAVADDSSLYRKKMTHLVPENVVRRWEETCAQREAMYGELKAFVDIALARESVSVPEEPEEDHKEEEKLFEYSCGACGSSYFSKGRPSKATWCAYCGIDGLGEVNGKPEEPEEPEEDEEVIGEGVTPSRSLHYTILDLALACQDVLDNPTTETINVFNRAGQAAKEQFPDYVDLVDPSLWRRACTEALRAMSASMKERAKE